MSISKMSKMEACGALCEIKRELEKQWKIAAEVQGKIKADKVSDTDEQQWRERHYEEETTRLFRWMKAIEMAGVALTR